MADTSTSPHCFFFYGTYRDDAIKAGQYWNAKTLLKGVTDARTAKLYNYKMYQSKYFGSSPFAIETNDTDSKDNYIIGRVITFDDAYFDTKLKRMNEIKSCKPVNRQDKYSHFQIIVRVYLETDEEKTNGIMARTYIKDMNMIDFDHCIEIESNDWMRRNILKSEIKTVTYNRIRSAKGGVRLRSSKSTKYFQEWKEDMIYKKGVIVAVKPKKKPHGGYISRVTLWAMCINRHESNRLNKPCVDDIFADLLINISLFIQMYLIQHVKGFNSELSSIIIKYCYKTNDVWWNGCYDQNKSGANCGNLVAGLISTELCKMCAIKQLNINVEDVSEPIKGAIICLNKTEGIMQRKYVSNINEEKEADNNYKNIILRTNITSKSEKHKIYNLLTRNFNESMKPLIKACVENKKIFIYKSLVYDTDVEINIGDTNIWALYDNMNGKEEELLCALIWRYVHGKTTNVNSTRLMFETLFLSTYEHVRFNHYGKQMVKEIELYCIANGYDLMSVAAVPGHGEKFWASNGFQLEHCAAENDDKKDKSGRNEWLRNNMLVFDDTPLYAKYVGIL